MPGGHLEYQESFEACAIREVCEETDLEVTRLHFLTATNDILEQEERHFITVWMGGELKDPR